MLHSIEGTSPHTKGSQSRTHLYYVASESTLSLLKTRLSYNTTKLLYYRNAEIPQTISVPGWQHLNLFVKPPQWLSRNIVIEGLQFESFQNFIYLGSSVNTNLAYRDVDYVNTWQELDADFWEKDPENVWIMVKKS